MYWHEHYIEEAKTFGSMTGIDTIDLPNKGLLGGVEFRIWGANGLGDDKPDVWAYDRLTKVELIVNGSQVVKSLSGEQILADMFYKKTPAFSHDLVNMNPQSCEIFLYLNLGRFYHDTEYLLDLSKVNDPEIRLTYDLTLATIAGWGNGVAMATEPYRSVIPHILRDGPTTSLGYLKTSELYRFVSGPGKKENMMIPRGPTYSNLYVQSWYKSQGWGTILDKIELNYNMSDLIPFRLGPHELGNANLRQYGRCKIIQQFSAAGHQAYPCPIEQGVLYNMRFTTGNVMAGGIALWANYGSIPMRQTDDGVTAVTTDHNVQCVFEGIWPFSVAALPNFDPLDSRTWVDTGKFGDIMVRVEEVAAAGTDLTIKLIGDEVVTTY